MTSASRRAYIDYARGIAVLLMIEAHTTDAWTRTIEKRSLLYRDANILGGFAAPLFLWLAGLAVVLSATRTAGRTGTRASAAAAIVRRGLEIFVLAFLFRIQAFIVSPGNHLVTLFRVDILNIMGPSIAAAGVVWALASTTASRVALFAVLATVCSMLTPLARVSPILDRWPVWLQWYLRPAGDLTVFTLLPWAGFVFAGGAAGALLATAQDERAERRVHAALALAGAVLVALGFYTAGRPSIYQTSSFWTSSPTWFAIRVGILTVSLPVIYALAALAERSGIRLRPLGRLGQHSLFVYWIHVELVYGYSSWLWRQRLPLWGTAIAYVLFCVLIYRAIGWRDRIVGGWRSGRGVTNAAQTAPA
jgi:uncharacterized membrane protein